MTKKIIKPTLFVWIPFGLPTGIGTEDPAWLHVLLVILAAWFLFEKICASHR
jgi:hypothetical protein